MNSDIVIKQEDDTEEIASNSSESFYSLIDKPYYVDAMHYKMDK